MPILSIDNLTVLVTMLPLALTWLAMTLAGLLSQDKWSEHINDAIAIIFVLAAAIGDVYITGQFITGNLLVLVGIIATTAMTLLTYTCKPLQKWTLLLQKTILVFQEDGFHITAPPTLATPLATISVATTAAATDTSGVVTSGETTVTATNGDGETTQIARLQFKQPTGPL